MIQGTGGPALLAGGRPCCSTTTHAVQGPLQGRPCARTSPLNWLLLPLLATLIPPLYNRYEPRLFGIPFFYWYQLAAISIGVICTLIVYLVSTRR